MSDEAIVQFHRVIDELTLPLETRHRERLQCRKGCSDCCVDDISVYDVEAECIRQRHGELLRSGEPHAPGACAFLDEEGACRVYEHRPYVCRSQGLPLRWTEYDEQGQGIERRDICPLNEEGTPITQLPAEACWSIGWAEGALAQLQGTLDGLDELSFDDDDDDDFDKPGENRMNRVALRDLFSKRAEGNGDA